MTIKELQSSKESILRYLLKNKQATVQELAKELEISLQATRRHLKDLSEEQLIEYKISQKGMGRPNYVYQLSNKGKERFPNAYGEFAVSFLDTLAQTLGSEQIENVLKKQWSKKAHEYRDYLGQGDLGNRVKKLVELRQQEGYMAELLPVQEGQEYILAEHHCAIAEVAESFPSVCGNELDMFAIALADCIIERTHWLNDGQHRCGYLIKKKSRDLKK
jgi:DeoR family transcriptional regulator, suf operon transcriptional repressor